MAKPEIKRVHIVRKKTAKGDVKEYHYAFRGGPRFWDSSMGAATGPAYHKAYARILEKHRQAHFGHAPNSVSAAVTTYRESMAFSKLKPRTQSDYLRYLEAFDTEFGKDPIEMFEESESLAEIEDWKNAAFGHSPRLYDYATTVVTRLLNWGHKTGRLRFHHHHNVERHYKVDRSGVIWQPAEIRALLDVATERERRIILTCSEGGLAPQDACALTRAEVRDTPGGRRLYFPRLKTRNITSFPVTPALAEVIDTTPPDQERLLVALRGGPLKPTRASQIVKDVLHRANAAAAADPSRTAVPTNLRLYDMRGTAATSLLRAGCSLNEIATCMGWSMRTASAMIERYARVVPEVSDEVLGKLMRAQTQRSGDIDK
jgi:hypothetical protein